MFDAHFVAAILLYVFFCKSVVDPNRLLVLLVSCWFASSTIMLSIADPPGRSAPCLGLVVNRQPYLLGLLEFSGSLLMLPFRLVMV